MIAELGNYALALSLAIAVLLAIFPRVGRLKRQCAVHGIGSSDDVRFYFSS